MLNFFKNKKKEVNIYAPLNGEIIPLEKVPDPVFSQKMMGEGIAMIPTNGHVHAPVDGTIIQIARTKHAVGILAEDGSEILIHIGLETVALDGEGFRVAVRKGDKVSVGDLLIEVDWDYIKEHAKSTVTPIVITNSSESKKQYVPTEETVGIQGKTVIITSSGK